MKLRYTLHAPQLGKRWTLGFVGIRQRELFANRKVFAFLWQVNRGTSTRALMHKIASNKADVIAFNLFPNKYEVESK